VTSTGETLNETKVDGLAGGPIHSVGQGTDAMMKTPVDASSGASAVINDVGLVTWRFTQTLLKRLPDIADENPVKVSCGLAKLILEITLPARSLLGLNSAKVPAFHPRLSV
jgi:hypothetical protein